VQSVPDAHAEEPTCLCMSPDGRLLASGGADMVVRVWEFATGRLLSEVRAILHHPASMCVPQSCCLAHGGGGHTLTRGLVEILSERSSKFGIFLMGGAVNGTRAVCCAASHPPRSRDTRHGRKALTTEWSRVRLQPLIAVGWFGTGDGALGHHQLSQVRFRQLHAGLGVQRRLRGAVEGGEGRAGE
jgi:hypothetical protein